MRKLLLTLLLLPFSVLSQCDLELLGYDVNTGDITIVVHNSENCGCNEFTSPGTSCILGNYNNEAVYHLNLGIHFDSDTPPPDCAWDMVYFPGWWYLNFTFLFDPELPNNGAVSGDTLNFNIIPPSGADSPMWECWEQYNTAGMDSTNCVELVIWQINYSQTADSDSLLGGYQWTDGNCGLCADQTQSYPDVNNYNNFLTWCGDELPPPPIYVYPGCTDSGALNYDPDATEDDGSCEYPVVEGCNDPTACNYDINVTESGGLCVYCYSPYELGDSLCNQIEGYWDWYISIFPNCPTTGCTDPIACNYNPDATIDDDSCEYGEIYIDTIYIELPGDTIYQIDTLTITVTEIDTVYITEIEFIYDTTYITLPPDTITITEYITQYDTTYIELPPDTVTVTETEYVFITDTIVETEYIYLVDTIYTFYSDTVYVYELIEIDCETGLPCSEIRSKECNIYVPNAFTPDNDGYNDAWKIVLDPECWTDVKAKVISRWGNVVWESNDPNNLIWNGNFNGGEYYVPDGMYMWLFQARKIGTAQVEELRGHVTIIR